MTIKYKFLLVFILITLFASTLGLQLLKADQLANQQRERYLLSNQQIILALELKSILTLAIKDITDSLSIGEEELEEYQQGKVFINKIIKDLTQTTLNEEIFAQSRNNDNREDEVEESLKLKNEIEKLLKTFDNLIETKISKNKLISKELFEKYFEEQFEQILVPQIDLFIQSEREELAKIDESALKESSKVKRFTYLIWGTSFITFLVIFIIFYRSIATPLSQLKQAATQVGEKNYSFNFKINSDNELGAVAKAFQIMEQKIKAGFENIESLFGLIVEHSNDAIISFNFDGKITSWNKGAEQIYGYSHEETKDKFIFIIVPENLIEECVNIRERVKNGESITNYETKRTVKDGRIIDVLLNVNPIKDHNSNYIGVSSIARDITKIKKYQKSLIKAKNEAEIANNAKSEFLSRMSHEFRTPLNSILGFTQILQTETNNTLTDSQREKLGYVTNSGIHLLKLVNGLLDLTAIENGKLPITIEEVSLNKLIEESFDLAKESAVEKNLRFIDNIPPNKEIWVAADKSQLKKVLLNLLTNAIKYNQENGSVDISIELIATKTARLKIMDSGVGISEEKQNHIFQTFNAITPTASFEEGVGLGLSISKVLMEMMEGKIFFESQLGKGSSFFIELPLIREEIIPLENIDNKPSSIKNFNATIKEENRQETDLSKISIPSKLRVELLRAAEIYNYTKLESLINELSAHDNDGKLIAKLAKKYLQQYNVEKIIDVLNKTKQDP